MVDVRPRPVRLTRELPVLSLNTNMSALMASRYLGQTESALAITRARLSSGLRVNSARDDAAGLAISERLMAQIRGTDVAARNANVAISMAQIGDSAVGAVVDALQRMNELAVDAADVNMTTNERTAAEAEFDLLQADVANLVANTEYDGTTLLATNFQMAFQVGPNAGQTIQVNVDGLSAGFAGLPGGGLAGLSLSSTSNATTAMASIAEALSIATGVQAQWGAVQNRFDSVVSQLESSSLILTEARGRIVDADMAVEASNLARLLLLQDSAAAMLAQANVQRRQVLSLLLS